MDPKGGRRPGPDRGRRPDPRGGGPALAEELQGLLDRLGSDELRAIAVWKLEGYSNAEVAARLGCATVSIERRLRLIRKILSGD
jgi:DNA-directed RNA polymerase specialized sigma24 family protein